MKQLSTGVDSIGNKGANLKDGHSMNGTNILDEKPSCENQFLTKYYCTSPGCKEFFSRKYTLLIHLKTHAYDEEYHWFKNIEKIM